MRSDRRRCVYGAATMGWLLCLLSATPASAEECNSYLFPQTVTDVSLATIHAERLHLLRDGDGCPAADSKCVGKAYLVAGDHVLISGARDGYRCIAYTDGKRQSTGWVASNELTPDFSTHPAGDWADVWKRVEGDAVMTIKNRAGQYTASGIATYAVHPDNVRTGTAEGTLHETFSLTGPVASFSQNAGDPTSACTVTLKLVGSWLVINDGATEDANSGCGGMGVTFNGIYQRTLRRTAAKIKP